MTAARRSLSSRRIVDRERDGVTHDGRRELPAHHDPSADGREADHLAGAPQLLPDLVRDPFQVVGGDAVDVHRPVSSSRSAPHLSERTLARSSGGLGGGG